MPHPPQLRHIPLKAIPRHPAAVHGSIHRHPAVQARPILRAQAPAVMMAAHRLRLTIADLLVDHSIRDHPVRRIPREAAEAGNNMTAVISHYHLRFTNRHGEVYYFLAHGDSHGAIKLIGATTPNITKARRFETAPEALLALTEAGEPDGWDLVTVEK